MGVQVVLITFHPTRQTGRSAALVREVDEAIVLDQSFYAPHFTKRTVAPSSADPPDEAALRACAERYADSWAAGATREEMLELLGKEPSVPRDLYVQLVIAAEENVGSLREHGESKGILRREFWKALKTAARSSESAEPDEAADGR